jgi:hypothetical protein
MLHDPDVGLGVEVHTRVTGGDPAGVLDNGWFLADARAASLGDTRVLIPAPTRNAAHIIFHGQVFHQLDREHRIQLRQLLDLALLRARYETQIDWAEIERRFGAAGEAQALANYLLFAERLFGQCVPRLTQAPRAGALAMLEAELSRDHMQARLAKLEAHHDGLMRELLATRQYYEGRIDILEREIDGRVEALQREIDSLKASTSWRMTAPLRALATLLRGK